MSEIKINTQTALNTEVENVSEMENSWVLFELDGEQYGIRTENIREMVLFTEPTKVPDYPSHMRGVINLRGMVIPVIDLRKRLGKHGFLEETDDLVSTLKARDEDHVRWLNELKASAEKDRDFTLTTDPHACAFGKWYDNFTTDNQLLQGQLKKFDQPHRSIHNVAIDVAKFRNDGKKDDALARIQYAWNEELSLLRSLFRETIKIIKENVSEIVVIVESDDMRVGFVVDKVLEVTDITPSDIEDSPKIKNGVPSRFIRGLAKVGKEVKILLSVKELIFGADIDSVSVK